MVNKQVKKPVRIILDIADYKKRRDDSLKIDGSSVGGKCEKNRKPELR